MVRRVNKTCFTVILPAPEMTSGCQKYTNPRGTPHLHQSFNASSKTQPYLEEAPSPPPILYLPPLAPYIHQFHQSLTTLHSRLRTPPHPPSHLPPRPRRAPLPPRTHNAKHPPFSDHYRILLRIPQCLRQSLTRCFHLSGRAFKDLPEHCPGREA